MYCCLTLGQSGADQIKQGPGIVASLAAGLEPTRIVPYKTVGGKTLNLHVFEPERHRSSDKRACFVAIHGGGWTGGEPRRFYPFVSHFVRLGLVGISIEYRLVKKGNGVTPFDCVKDGRSALRYIRSHAAELGIDPTKIAVSGGSAGGHVAAGTALFDGVDDPADDKGVKPDGNALVLYFPVIDTSSEGYGNAKCGDNWKDISPLHRVRAGLPPTIVFHGTGDTVTPFKGASAFKDAMIAAGNRCEIVINDGGKHGYLMNDAAIYEDTMKRTEEFLSSLGFFKTAS